MTTRHSPVKRLKAQADKIASKLKAMERKDHLIDTTGKIAAAREKPSIKFAVAMDDKILTIEMSWKTIRETSEAGISEYIMRQMRESGESVH